MAAASQGTKSGFGPAEPSVNLPGFYKASANGEPLGTSGFLYKEECRILEQQSKNSCFSHRGRAITYSCKAKMPLRPAVLLNMPFAMQDWLGPFHLVSGVQVEIHSNGNIRQ